MKHTIAITNPLRVYTGWDLRALIRQVIEEAFDEPNILGNLDVSPEIREAWENPNPETLEGILLGLGLDVIIQFGVDLQSYEELDNAVTEMCQALRDQCRKVDPTEGGLDTRCGTLYLADDYLLTTQPRALDYYGGFEYVPTSLQINGVKLYPIEYGRVSDVFDLLEESSND